MLDCYQLGCDTFFLFDPLKYFNVWFSLNNCKFLVKKKKKFSINGIKLITNHKLDHAVLRKLQSPVENHFLVPGVFNLQRSSFKHLKTQGT